jgi:hypothetical protein
MERSRRPRWQWILAGLAGLAALAGIILAVWTLPSLLYGDVSQASPDTRLQATSGFRTALVAGLAGLAALGSLAMATRTHRLTQQGQITERYTKAIEQLGSDKLDVRLGGIYALERIAKDSRRDLPTVVEVLSAFVREHSDSVHTDSEPSVAKVLITFLQNDREPAGERQSNVKQSHNKPNPSTDVRAALAVLGRLPSLPDGPQPDLTNARLADAHLRGMTLKSFRLRGTVLPQANLALADLQRADLREADLQEANLQGARLQGAFLSGVQLQGAECDAGTVWPDGFDWKAAGVLLLGRVSKVIATR